MKALVHVFPEWDPDDEANRSLDEPALFWRGRMRLIGRQRARTLRRRGVPVLRSVEITSRGRHRHAWFVEDFR